MEALFVIQGVCMSVERFFGVEERRAGKHGRTVTVVHEFEDECSRNAWVKRRNKRNRDSLTEIHVTRRAVEEKEASSFLVESSERSGFDGGLVKHSFFDPKSK